MIVWGNYHNQKNPWEETLFRDNQGRYEWETIAYWKDGSQTSKLHYSYRGAQIDCDRLMNSPWGRKMIKNCIIIRNRG